MEELSFDKLPEAVAQLKAQVEEIKNLLITKSNSNESDPEQLFTVDECADFLRLSKQTIYKHVSGGKLPVLKRSKRNYFLKSDLIEYLKSGRKKSNAEIEDDAIEKLIKARR